MTLISQNHPALIPLVGLEAISEKLVYNGVKALGPILKSQKTAKAMTPAKHCFLHSIFNYNMDLILPVGQKGNFPLYRKNPHVSIAEVHFIKDL